MKNRPDSEKAMYKPGRMRWWGEIGYGWACRKQRNNPTKDTKGKSTSILLRKVSESRR